MSQPLVDFSSFTPDEEKCFVPFELAMRDHARRATLVGLAVAGGLLAVLLLICLGLYSPCNAFCARPLGNCRTPAQVDAWRASCERACGAVERGAGVTIESEVGGGGDTRVVKLALGGSEYVRTLNACVFSGGGGATCSSLVKAAQTRGLWCEDGK